MNADISPSDSIVVNTISPEMAYPSSIDAGPPLASDFPDPRKSPVPIVPPIAIICTCREDSFRDSWSPCVIGASGSDGNGVVAYGEWMLSISSSPLST